ncbi:MAG: malto-oligosyltrehalose synthase [Alphaproteobacteria bacterium]|uniref:Malto-oligosyltrehalose synthase n=1 Tax=Candidatus Nitrobium versatile TaxID=2884831 RepID=A0A953JDQ0_9BACT|nr:malto-oligosyltrehalose synthase [Candidatus Nitrobium versatile]
MRTLLEARVPCSLYRLQLNGPFGFAEAARTVAYLHDLGITDIYSSPCFRAKRGSPHCYDIVDHASLHPELGTEEEYQALTGALAERDMGQLLDIVPNHMGIEGGENPWWTDVLENGPSSPYADFFDIDWTPVKRELHNKVLLPLLGNQYGAVLENGELQLVFEEGAFFIAYHGHRFPVRPQSGGRVLRHCLGELERTPPPDDSGLTELQSIITALSHLPPYTERSPERTVERQREKEVIKGRLRTLCRKSTAVAAHIGENLRLFNGTPGVPGSFDMLDTLLSEQVYRLSYWRVAAEEINYRRFFDINDLAAVRMEDPRVFEAAHRLTLRLVREGKVTGLRIDHPDGLYHPLEYFERLQRACFLASGKGRLERMHSVPPGDEQERERELERMYETALAEDPKLKPFYIVGEKILMRGERMPDDWPLFSTTGYVFMNSVSGLFVDPDGGRELERIYERFVGRKMSFIDIAYEKKKLVMKTAMASEINTLGHYLNTLSERNRHTRDFTLNSLIAALIEIIALFPVYRTYISSAGVNDRDRRYIESAVAKAKRKNPALSEPVFDFLRDVLLLRCPPGADDEGRREWLDFVMRFQQVTGPVTAKGVEDTAFYVYNRLVSLNEVGGSPDRFGTSLETFHGQNMERAKYWPGALITTGTHDSKRGEDVRMRINVLSEIPGEWKAALIRWRKMNNKKRVMVDGRAVPDRNDEYLLYQTLLGAWPAEPMDDEVLSSFRRRIREYMRKAVREAKTNTSWINPDALYEDALFYFIDSLLAPGADNRFLRDFRAFQQQVSIWAAYGSLSQTLLKLTSPGVPDIYQGAELWDYRLVDPDNRRPVDYGRRRELLADLLRREAEQGQPSLVRALLAGRDDGRSKLYLIAKTLRYRRANRALFEKGDYLPLEVIGGRSGAICAFARTLGHRKIVVAAPRLFTRFAPDPAELPLGAPVWGDTRIAVPFAEKGTRFRNIFTGETVVAPEDRAAAALPAARLFASFLPALLEQTDGTAPPSTE